MAVKASRHGHRVEELRSIEMHRLIGSRLDEDVRERALAQLRRRDERDAEAGRKARPSSSAWRKILLLPDRDLAALLTDDSEEMRDLRQDTPFAGILSPEDRWEIIRRIQ